MKSRTWSLGFLLAFALAPASAAPARSADAPAFDDPGMHFSAPTGWTRVDQSQIAANAGDSQQDPPAAVFVFHPGERDQRTIVITIAPFDGSLDALDTRHESDLRAGGDATFIEKRTKTTLANGMPAYWLRISSGADAGRFMRRYEYVVYDSVRSIVVTFSGRQGDVTDADAQAALGSLYVVAFPRGARRS